MVDSTHHPHALGEIHTTWCLTNYALIKRHTSGSLQLAYTQNHRTARKIDNLRKKKKTKANYFPPSYCFNKENNILYPHQIIYPF